MTALAPSVFAGCEPHLGGTYGRAADQQSQQSADCDINFWILFFVFLWLLNTFDFQHLLMNDDSSFCMTRVYRCGPVSSSSQATSFEKKMNVNSGAKQTKTSSQTVKWANVCR